MTDHSNDGGGSIGSPEDRYSSMRQEIELAQKRLAARERILPQGNENENLAPLPIQGSDSSSVVRTAHKGDAPPPPPLPSMALWGTSALAEKTSSAAANIPDVRGLTVPAVEKAANKTSSSLPKISEGMLVAERISAAIRIPQDKATKEMLNVDRSTLAAELAPLGKTNLADRIPSYDRALLASKPAVVSAEVPVNAVANKIGAFSLAESLRGVESESSKLLAQLNLYEKFSTCHEHISWGPDGSVSVALKSHDGYRRTIVCRADGTSAQRITDPNGKEIVRFSSNGQVVKNLDDTNNRTA